VEIPKSVTKIGASAFDKCNKLDSVTCWGNPTPSLSEPEGDQGVFRGKSSTANLYVDNITFKNKYENSAWNHYFDANHIVAIGKYHFIKNGVCYHIEDGNSNVYVARPSKNTFYAKDIDVPEKVTNDSSIYLKGTKWEEIQTYNVIGVQDSAFAKIDTSGNSITLPKTITYWGGGCFAPIIKDSVCKSIGVLYIKALKPNKDSVKLGKLFGDTSSIKGTFHTTLKVNDNISKEWFENTLKWKNSGNKRDYFKNIVVANSCDIERDGVWYVLNDSSKPEDSTLKVIKRSDGKLYSGDIVLPDRLPYIDGEYYTVTKIDSLAFRDCTGLTSIDIGDSIQWILNGAFKNCTGLTNLYIGNPDKWATKTLGDYLSNPMYYAHKFKVRGAKRATTDLTLSTPIIKDNTFSGCSDLKRVTFTPEVKDIGSRVFDWCNNLEEVYCMHKDWNLIPDLNVGMKTHVFSSNLKNNKTKLYAISDIWTKQPNKCWDHYFDIMDAVYIYYGEGGNEIVPYSKIKVSSKNCQIKVSGANDVQILDTNGNLIDKMSGNGEGELISKTLSKGGYIVLAETKDASYYEKVLVQ
ncbi:MAG TPA: hypothetical protein DDY68_03880, partial [Porphyromonadaceae bacterium]|nr:hypothetical protein [Porphyromonadaceae bacterium]